MGLTPFPPCGWGWAGLLPKAKLPTEAAPLAGPVLAGSWVARPPAPGGKQGQVGAQPGWRCDWREEDAPLGASPSRLTPVGGSGFMDVGRLRKPS